MAAPLSAAREDSTTPAWVHLYRGLARRIRPLIVHDNGSATAELAIGWFSIDRLCVSLLATWLISK
jgi:hypothetical protein